LNSAGAVAASMLGYVLPGVLYLQTYKAELKVAWSDAIGLETEDADMSDANSVQVMNNIIHKNNSDNSDIHNDMTFLNGNNVNSSDTNNSLSSESTMSDNNENSSETKNLVTGRKRKSKYQKFRALSRFFMPFFMILFGCLSMIIGVTSVFLF
jgi:lipopolysaccharide export LptBFGC system permease protein LptF